MFNKEGSGASLKTALSNSNVILDTSKATSLSSMFGYSAVLDVPVINTTSADQVDRIFESSRILKTIDTLVLRDNGSQTFNNVFVNCNELENLAIEGAIGQNGFNVQWCSKLTHDSLISIINALQDKTSDTSGTVWKVTVGETNLAKLSDDELEIARQKGWNIA